MLFVFFLRRLQFLNGLLQAYDGTLQALDLPVGGIEFLLVVDTKFRDVLLQKINIALQAARTPLHGLFDGADFDAGHVLRIEDELEDDRYVIRAEVPGIDPDKDVEITVSDGVLTIAAERREQINEKGRSEFHYGSFVRRVSLPAGAVEDKLAARYQDGILEVTVPVEAVKAEPRTIPVARGSAE